MDVKQLKDEVRAGTIAVDRVVDLLANTQQQLKTAQQRITELEKKLGIQANGKVDEPFSVRSEEKRQEARGKVKRKKKQKSSRRGRVTTAEKVAQAQQT